MKKKEWFGEWFDSPYYHILYKHRDHDEARDFIERVINLLTLKPNHKILDLACGKGRHSIYLNKKGFDVVGCDLSEQNIAHAKKYENERLHFEVHDMREPFASAYFDIVLNLFTSFGYFESKEEHQLAIACIAKALKPGGRFLLDFLNPFTVIHHLKPEEVKVLEGIEFHITKNLSPDDYIVKDIKFEIDQKQYHYQERVKALRRVDFLEYFKQAGLNVEHLYGDYLLNPYQAETSERMIFLVKK